jgi:drug/metabolite transporter (DMT)-like permease
LLGVFFLNEKLSWQLIAGTILIIMSLTVVNYKKKTA